MEDWSRAPEEILGLVTGLRAKGFTVRSTWISDAFNQVAELWDEGAAVAVRVHADRGFWSIDLGPAGSEDFFTPDHWAAGLDGRPLEAEVSSLREEVDFVDRRASEVVRAVQRDPGLTGRLRRERKIRVYERFGWPLPAEVHRSHEVEESERVPEEVHGLVADLFANGFTVRSSHFSNVRQQVHELWDEGGTTAVRVSVDRSPWYIELGPAGTDDLFDPDVWVAGLDGRPLGTELSPLSDRVEFVRRRAAEAVRAVQRDPGLVDRLRRHRRSGPTR